MEGWVWWAPAGAATLHIVEEFAFPGGFAAWDRRYRPNFAASITPRFHVIVNAMMLALCAGVGLQGPTPSGVAAWLTVAALLATNAVWHVVGAVRTRSYSPGMVTGILLYLPLALGGYPWFIRSGEASVGTAVIALAIGASYTLWVGRALHRWRARPSRGAGRP